MTTFDSREKAFEDLYAHDLELQFKVVARRNRLLGLWAAKLLGRDGAAAEEYAKEVIISDFEEPGDADVLRKVLGDFTAASITIGEPEIRKQMNALLKDAKQQMFTEVKI